MTNFIKENNYHIKIDCTYNPDWICNNCSHSEGFDIYPTCPFYEIGDEEYDIDIDIIIEANLFFFKIEINDPKFWIDFINEKCFCLECGASIIIAPFMSTSQLLYLAKCFANIHSKCDKLIECAPEV